MPNQLTIKHFFKFLWNNKLIGSRTFIVMCIAISAALDITYTGCKMISKNSENPLQYHLHLNSILIEDDQGDLFSEKIKSLLIASIENRDFNIISITNAHKSLYRYKMNGVYLLKFSDKYVLTTGSELENINQDHLKELLGEKSHQKIIKVPYANIHANDRAILNKLLSKTFGLPGTYDTQDYQRLNMAASFFLIEIILLYLEYCYFLLTEKDK